MFEIGAGIGFIVGVATTIMWVIAMEKDKRKSAGKRGGAWAPEHPNCRCFSEEMQIHGGHKAPQTQMEVHPDSVIRSGAMDSLAVLKGAAKVRSEFDARKALAKQREKRGRKS